MNQDVLVTALVESARKRRFLGRAACARLGDFARQKGVQNVEDVRRWLVSGDGLSAPLANQLKSLLPKEGESPYGPYLPITHLAEGGMGSVWLACSPKQELVVVKTLRNSIAQQQGTTQGTEFMKRFEREAKITMQLTHPSVVRCLDTGVRADGTAFMVLEYVDSGDLKELVDSRAGLSEGLALAILHQVVDALGEAHRIKLVHRDIKPANIFVASDGRAKLADFGIARSTEQNRTMLTMEGAIVGSPLYMSPEQIISDPNLDIRSDIYAMGAVLYYALAAKAPYDGRIQEVLHKHCTAVIPDVRKERPKVSERTHQIILGCMQKERDKRYREPAELLAAIADALVRLGLTPGGPLEEDTRPGDLSDAESGFRPAATGGATMVADLSGNADGATMVADLSGGGDAGATMAADLSGNAGATHATMVHDAHTIVANLLAQQPAPATSRITNPNTTLAASETNVTVVKDLSGGDTAATMALTPAQMMNDATAATMAGVGVPATALEGDFTSALAQDWIALCAQDRGDPTQILLWARTKIAIGKLREPPVDCCVRNYPVLTHKEASQRVSRQHLALQFDAVQGGCMLTDLGAANGTMVDGIAVKANTGMPLETGKDAIVVLGGTVALWVRPVGRKSPAVRALAGAPASTAPQMAGIDCAHPLDAIVVTRPENRPELAYAMVLRRLTIGGPGAELACAGARSHAAIEVALYAGRWIWRVAGGPLAWKPLSAGTVVDVGGRQLVARPGDYAQFD